MAGELTGAVVNNTGLIRARSIEEKNGEIYLLGGMSGGEFTENNAIRVGGVLDASAPDGGDGGFIETSAARVMIEEGVQVGTRAVSGATGTWLIDPKDFTIAESGGDISGATLSSNLGGGSVAILSSSGASDGSGDIHVNDAVSWSANTLTLTAAHDININAVMTASGTAALTMNTATANGGDSAVSGGAVKVGFNEDGSFKGRVDFPGRSGTGFLTINDSGYTVINSLGSAGSTTGLDLQGMNGGLAGRYALGSDINAGDSANNTADWNSGAGFTPVGYDWDNAFTG